VGRGARVGVALARGLDGDPVGCPGVPAAFNRVAEDDRGDDPPPQPASSTAAMTAAASGAR
jgi:hypothetical protein